MTTVLATVGALALIYLGARAIAAAVAHRRNRRAPERLEECSCGAVVPVSKAHLVSTVFADADEVAMGGNTAVVAAFCRAHCPGGCNHPNEHR
jgi:hypothetical protein